MTEEILLSLENLVQEEQVEDIHISEHALDRFIERGEKRYKSVSKLKKKLRDKIVKKIIRRTQKNRQDYLIEFWERLSKSKKELVNSNGYWMTDGEMYFFVKRHGDCLIVVTCLTSEQFELSYVTEVLR